MRPFKVEQITDGVDLLPTETAVCAGGMTCPHLAYRARFRNKRYPRPRHTYEREGSMMDIITVHRPQEFVVHDGEVIKIEWE